MPSKMPPCTSEGPLRPERSRERALAPGRNKTNRVENCRCVAETFRRVAGRNHRHRQFRELSFQWAPGRFESIRQPLATVPNWNLASRYKHRLTLTSFAAAATCRTLPRSERDFLRLTLTSFAAAATLRDPKCITLIIRLTLTSFAAAATCRATGGNPSRLPPHAHFVRGGGDSRLKKNRTGAVITASPSLRSRRRRPEEMRPPVEVVVRLTLTSFAAAATTRHGGFCPVV